MNVDRLSALMSQWSGVMLVLAAAPQSAQALSLNTTLLGGYEVLSYRDDPTKLDGGSVSAGDAFDQTSFKGPAFGLGVQVGLFQTDLIEPFVGIDLVNSQLSKSAESDGISSQGKFSFLHAGIGFGGRLWLGRALNLTAGVSFSRTLSDEMKTSKKETASGQSLGEIDFKMAGHKKTSAQLGVALFPSGEGFSLGLDLRIGSGCFECSAESSALQKRAYLTRSGALTVAWYMDSRANSLVRDDVQEDEIDQINSRLKSRKKDALRRKKSGRKQMPLLED